MRETTLGRWMSRLVVTVGVGVVALGMSTATAQASAASNGVASVQLGELAHAVQSTASGLHLHATEGFDWS